jgi:hypothetical protein
MRNLGNFRGNFALKVAWQLSWQLLATNIRQVHETIKENEMFFRQLL